MGMHFPCAYIHFDQKIKIREKKSLIKKITVGFFQ